METTEIPEQHQTRQPGLETKMEPKPESTVEEYNGSGKLRSKVAIITGAGAAGRVKASTTKR